MVFNGKIICIWIPGGIDSTDKDGMSKEAGKDTRSVERQVWKTQDGMFQLARWANRYSPLVGFPELVNWKRELAAQEKRTAGKHVATQYAHQPDPRAAAWKTEAIWLDVTDVCHYFETVTKLAERIREDLTRLDIVARVAAASTVGASWAACLYLVNPTDNQSVVLSIDQQDQAAIRQELGQLPVNSLRLPATALDALARLGILTLEQLWALPQEAIAQRLGAVVTQRCQQLFGQVIEPLTMIYSQQRYISEQLLPGPIGGVQMVVNLFRYLLEPILERLKKRGRGVLQLSCKFEVSRYGQRTYCDTTANVESETVAVSGNHIERFTIGLYRPTVQCAHLVSLFQLAWEKVGRIDEMYYISIEATQTAVMQQVQLGLFTEKESEQPVVGNCELARDQIPPSALARLIDRLTSRLGKKRVSRPQLSAEAQPELSFEMQAVVELDMQRWCNHVLRPARKSLDTSGGQAPPPTPQKAQYNNQRSGWALGQQLSMDSRPLWHWSSPLEIQCHTKSRSGAPVRLFHSGNWQQVTRFWGPERIETGWWRSRAVRREYFRVEIDTGQRFWVFRLLPTSQWFLQGNFG
jgi:protein ImuB